MKQQHLLEDLVGLEQNKRDDLLEMTGFGFDQTMIEQGKRKNKKVQDEVEVINAPADILDRSD